MKAISAWDDSLNILDPETDHAHHVIVDYFVFSHTAIAKDGDKAGILLHLDKLTAMIGEHFVEEELEFGMRDRLDCFKHIVSHHAILDALAEARRRIEAMPDPQEAALNLIFGIASIFRRHIAQEDRSLTKPQGLYD